ncbi:MAG TPA: NYN domain-containing protein [Saprospiraceae bacterium]|nr:NYN domain-containing protein [Saprospiraceae bacterium]HNG90193.1 NYN domain-containing protein [Saprospiraceae bacterium]
MERVITYIDGFNLYFGMKAEFGDRYLWLDVEALSKNLLLPTQELVKAKYFTSRVTNQPDKERRQNNYLEALQAHTTCNIYYGQYQANVIECKSCRSVWPSPKEKMTDVNIATQILVDAFNDNFDTALVISGDADLLPPILAVRDNFPGKRIGIYFPPRRHSISLKSRVNFSGVIGKSKLRDSQLPAEIEKPDGYILRKPIHWG